ncbi:MAG: glycosyltransferase family 2 protein [Planctomycetaceae bacterium]|nr:glycosyltransferase family 2 protein [Planctomycetaceae bacterium]
MSRFEAVTICRDYADFLEHVIPANQPHFDDWVVVTCHSDEPTFRVCERYGVRTVFCPYFAKNSSPFNKALAVNLGLAHLKCSDWMIHIDADTVLPGNFRKLVENADLRKDAIYGIDRVNCPSWDEWQRHRTSNSSSQKHYLIQPPGGWHLGSRLSHHDYGGYVPIGFFQMWNRESNISRYPTTQDGGAEHTDLLHGLQWPRPNRVLIPEIIAIHLESEPSSMGANWNGRTTKAFGPESRGSSMMAGKSVHRSAPQRPTEFFSAAHGYVQGK